MNLRKKIEARIQEIESDPRYKSMREHAVADITRNAPLAIIQTMLESEHVTLKNILKWINDREIAKEVFDDYEQYSLEFNFGPIEHMKDYLDSQFDFSGKRTNQK